MKKDAGHELSPVEGALPCAPAPDSPNSSANSPNPPPAFDHELLRRIGGGSYGEVWLARNALGSYRAVKIVHRSTFEHERPFEREFEGIQKFEPISRSHEGLVDLLQVGRNDAEGYFYYVMELADGASDPCSVISDQYSAATARVASPTSLNTDRLITDYSPRTLRQDLKQRGRLPLDNCIQLGMSLTNALAYLHGQGLIHRDIKPSNIIFVGGVPKLADVGLVAGVNEARSYVGTEGFIPPEGPGSPQADLYSLGIVLYEMSTGKSHQDFPEPLADLAAQPDHARWLEFNAVIHKACVSDVRERYPCAEAMHAELALLQRGASVRSKHAREHRLAVAKKISVATAALALVASGAWFLFNRFNTSTIQRLNEPAAELKSIAVLPFDNDSPNKADEYLGPQMTEELSAILAKIPDTRVLGQGSAAAVKKATDRSAAFRQLKLDAVLEGTVRKTENALRVTAQLVGPRNSYQLWSQVYDGELADIFGIQTDIAEHVAAALNIELTSTLRTRLAVRAPSNLQAYQLCQEASFHAAKSSREGVLQAIELFQKAIAIQTNYAPAHAGLAKSYMSLYGVAPFSSLECYTNARPAAEKSLLLDPELGAAHEAVAIIKSRYEWDWPGAEQAFRRAIRLDPHNAELHLRYGTFLSGLGRHAEAIAEGRRAISLDPISPGTSGGLAWIFYFARDYANALNELQRALLLDPNFHQTYFYLGQVYERMGKYEETVEAGAKSDALVGRVKTEQIEAEREAFRTGGMPAYWRTRAARAVIRPARKVFSDAKHHARLGETGKALEMLEKAHAAREAEMPWLNVFPMFDNLRSEPRFLALLKDMGLDK